MSLIANTNRNGEAHPNEALFDGHGTSGIATTMFPGSYATTAVGGNILTSGSTVLSQAGVPTQISEGFFFHHLFQQLSSTEYGVTCFISNGPVLDVSGDPNLATPILEWIERFGYKSVNLKKRNNGTLGSFSLIESPTPQGNGIRVVLDAPISKETYDSYYANPGTYFGPLFSEVSTLRRTVGQLRDCKVHIRPTEPEELVVDYTNVYTADANDETLWVQDSKGNLVTRIDMNEDGDTRGSFRVPLKPFQTYTFTVPGYSYRNYSMTLNDSTQWTVEPTKLQFLGTLEANATFYFKVLANEEATFCMKDYNRGAVEGTYGAVLTRLQDDEVTDVVLDQQTYYYQHQSVPLPVSAQEQHYKVVLKGAGRTAMWLDGIPNIFSSRLSWYIRPTILDNEVLLSFPDPTPMNYRGHIPLVGHYMPYTDIPETAKADLESLKAQTANIYTFADVMSKTPSWENGFKEYMSGVLGLERDWTLLAKTGRVAVIDFENDPEIQQGVDAWIKNIHRINDGKEHYIAAADEPNLNYPSFEAYRKHFVAFANYVRSHPLSAAAKIKIVSPASSRFDHGTTVDGARLRKGQYWAQSIIEEYPELVDGIAWHDWTVRGLLNVRQYQTAVEAAYELSNGGQRKLALEQTNTSGGQSVSLYDQNTEFATVWWASVFINVSRTGKLDDLMWFPIADELDHPKGLFAVDESTGTFSFKLVGLFHKWLMGYLHGAKNSRVFDMAQPHIEIDVVNWKDTFAGLERDMTIGVNKSNRSYTINLGNNSFPEEGVFVETFNPDGTTSTLSPTYTGGLMKIVIPANTVFLVKRQAT